MQKKYQLTDHSLKEKWTHMNQATKEAVCGALATVPSVTLAFVSYLSDKTLDTLSRSQEPAPRDAIIIFMGLQLTLYAGAVFSGVSSVISLGFFGKSIYHYYKQSSPESELNESTKLTGSSSV
jgi:hypothetical protein